MENVINVWSIIITFNGTKWIHNCFRSLDKSGIKNHHILAIDNGSTDNTVDLIRQYYPAVEIIETGENLGFGKANNIGMKKAVEANADYVFLLNQDAWVEKNTLKFLVSFAEKYKDFGILSPLHLSNSKDKIDSLFLKYISESDYKKLLNDYLVGAVKDIYEINFVNAAAWLLPRQTIEKIGYFDPLFFMYGEDDNYIQRIKFHTLKVGIVPSVFIVHDRNEVQKKIKPKQLYQRKRSVFYKLILNPNNNSLFSIIVAFSYLAVCILRQLLEANFSTAFQLFQFGVAKMLNINKILKERAKY